MPPEAGYWKHFKVVGVVAYCLVAECQQPNISLGALPKPGENKRLRKRRVQKKNSEKVWSFAKPPSDPPPHPPGMVIFPEKKLTPIFFFRNKTLIG